MEAPRKLPALARIWDGEVLPYAPERIARSVKAAFLALPEAAAAEIAPALLDAGVRVIDLSGAFRLRDDAARAQLVSRRRTDAAGGRRLRPRPSSSAAPSPRAQLVAIPGLLPDRRAARAGAARSRRPARPAPTSSSTPSRACRAPARRRPSARTSPRTTAAWRPTACSATGTAPRSSRALGGRRSRSRRTWCRSTAASSTTIYVRVAPGTTERGHRRRLRRRLRGRAVRARSSATALPEIKHVAHTNFCDIGWRVDEPIGPR